MSCPHLPIFWETRVGTSSWDHRGTIPYARLHVCCESTSNVHLGQGGPDNPSRKRGGQVETGGDEGGEEGAVD